MTMAKAFAKNSSRPDKRRSNPYIEIAATYFRRKLLWLMVAWCAVIFPLTLQTFEGVEWRVDSPAGVVDCCEGHPFLADERIDFAVEGEQGRQEGAPLFG